MAMGSMIWLLDHERLYEEALVHCEKALDVNSNFVYALSYKGKILVSLKRYTEAISCYDKVLEIDPDNRRAAYHREKAKEKVAKNGSRFRVFR